MSCVRIITPKIGPKAGQETESKLYNNLVTRGTKAGLNEKRAEAQANYLYEYVHSPKFKVAFGDWINNSNLPNLDENGEPLEQYVQSDGNKAIESIAKMFNMTGTGYLSNNIQLEELKATLIKNGFSNITVLPTSNKNGYYFSIKGKMFNPFKSSYFQITNTNDLKADPKLDALVKAFADKLGITISMNGVTDEDGNPIDAIAKADILNKIIQVAQGKADITTLTEEVASFFVEMLPADSVLMRRMMRLIKTYPIYDEVRREYSNDENYRKDGWINEDKIAKEAITKLIALNAIKVNNVEFQKKEQFDTWWNQAWDYIKTKVLDLVREYKGNPFDQSARIILRGDTSGLVQSKSNEIYFQKTTYDLIKESNELGLIKKKAISATEDAYFVNDIQVPNRVTTVSKSEGKRRNSFISEEDQKKFDKDAERGTMVHSWAEEITKVLLHNNYTPVLYNGLSLKQKENYKKIQVYLTNLIDSIKKEDPNAQFLTEVMIYDPNRTYNGKRGIAGTIDLLVIHGDGSASIYDFKSRRSQSVYHLKEKEYDSQMTIYKQMLKAGNPTLGIPKITEFKQTRIIPIKLTVKDNIINTVEIEEQISVAYEDTKYDKVNKLISYYTAKIDNLVKVKLSSDPAKREKEIAQINALRKAKNDLIVKNNVDSIYNEAIFELRRIENALNDGTELDVNDALKITELYTTLANFIDDSLKTDELKNKLRAVMGWASELNSKIQDEIKSVVLENGKEAGYNEKSMFTKQKGFSLIKRLFYSFSQINHPYFVTLRSLITKAQLEKQKDSDALRDKLKTLTNNLVNWGKANGLSGLTVYDKLVNKETGNLISEYSKEFWTTRKKYEQEDSLEARTWLNTELELDKPKYEAALAKYTAIVNKTVYDKQNATINNKIRANKIKDFKEQHNDLATSYYTKIKNPAKWKSKEFSYISQKGNEALLEFYNYYTETVKSLEDILGEKLGKTFIPNIPSSTIQKMMEQGFGSYDSIREDIIKGLTVQQEDNQVGMTDEYGNRTYKVPKYFINKLNANEKSFDLGINLQLFGEMAYNYKYMTEIEQTVLTLQNALDLEGSVPTDNTGKPIRDGVSKRLKESLSSDANTVETFKSFVNYYLYGISNKEENNASKILNKYISYTSVKALGLNPLTAITSTTSGIANAYMQGTRGVEYTRGNMNKSLGMITTRDKKAYGILSVVKPYLDDKRHFDTRDLSTDWKTRVLTTDNLYLMMRKGDDLVQGAIFLSLCQTHTFDKDNNIVSIKQLAKKEIRPSNYYSLSSAERKDIDAKIKTKESEYKNLLDLIEVKEDGLYNGNKKITPEQINKFKLKSQQSVKIVLGNTDPNDIMTVKLTMWGKALMQFKNWMPRYLSERYGDLNYSRDLERYERGKYLSLWNQVTNKYVLEELKNLKFNLLANPIEVAKGLYQEYLTANPEAEMTEEEFIDLHLENLRAAYAGIAMTIAVLGLFITAGLAYDDDEEKPTGYKAFLKILNRSYTELAFASNPIEFTKLLKSPVAAAADLARVTKVFQDFGKEVYGQITDNEEMTKTAKPLRGFKQTIPGLAAPERLWGLIDEEYEKMR